MIDVLHNRGGQPCGGVAFAMTRRPSPGDRLSAADVVYHDGTVAIAGAVVHCGACGREVDVNGELTLTPPVESGDDG